MLTARGWWFLTLATIILVLGAAALADFTVVPALVALTLVAWFIFEWVLFNVRVNTAVARLKVTRRVIQGDREVPMVWAGLAFEVRVRIQTRGPLRLAIRHLRGSAAASRGTDRRRQRGNGRHRGG